MAALEPTFPFDQSQEPHRSDLAAAITRAASKQTYYTVRFLVDRELIPDAYRAYAYFRWVDDCIDANTGDRSEKIAFINRQQSLLDACYRQESIGAVNAEEQMLVDLVRNDLIMNDRGIHDQEMDSGLQAYLRNMMAVMAFDVERRGRLISQAELENYSELLATAVTEALLFFIGHRCPSPCGETRYLAVRGAHVIHMLRDACEDTEAGYFNIPLEYLQEQALSCQEMGRPVYRNWVSGRVELARGYFRSGREYIFQVQSFRCRLAGFAYVARFEWMLRAIERDEYRLRPDYPERKSLRAGLWMAWRTLLSAFGWYRPGIDPVNSGPM
jgi:phytoene/squalene synthetase